jgi:hypothetical protein
VESSGKWRFENGSASHNFIITSGEIFNGILVAGGFRVKISCDVSICGNIWEAYG